MRRALLVLVPLLALLAGGCTDVEGTDGLTFVGADFQYVEIPPAERGQPIESSGTTIDGGTLDLADYRGKTLVVNVWWSGCGPCIKELPLLVDAVRAAGTDVALAGINIRDASAANAAAFERGLGVDFPSIYDPSSRTLLDFGNKLNPRAIPSTAVLDDQGRLAALISGPIPTEQTLVDIVEKVQDAGGAGDGGGEGG